MVIYALDRVVNVCKVGYINHAVKTVEDLWYVNMYVRIFAQTVRHANVNVKTVVSTANVARNVVIYVSRVRNDVNGSADITNVNKYAASHATDLDVMSHAEEKLFVDIPVLDYVVSLVQPSAEFVIQRLCPKSSSVQKMILMQGLSS